MKDNEPQEDSRPQEELFFLGDVGIKDKRLHSYKQDFWVEEAYIQGRGDDAHYFGITLSKRKLSMFLAVLFLGVFALFVRSAFLQVIKVDEYLNMAENNRIRVYYLQAPRGIVYDRNEIPLVRNIANFSLFITPVDFPHDEDKKTEMKNLLEQYFHNEKVLATFDKVLSLTPQRKEYYQPHAVVDSIEYDNAVRLRLASTDMAGVSIGITHQREYLLASDHNEDYWHNSLSHLLGYVGKVNQDEYTNLEANGYLFNDVIGKSGVEKAYEDLLRGVYGRKQIEVDSMGKEKKIIAQDDIVKGQNIILSIDHNMQSKLEELIRSKLVEKNLTKGVGLVQDPRNGEVLAMVSLPSYNNNVFAQGISSEQYQVLLEDENKPLFNRAISGEYPSGSTFKPAVAAAALQEGIITASTTFLSTGGIRIYEWFFPDWRAGGHGVTNVKKALADSVNTFFYIIGGGYNEFEGLGNKKIKKYGELFGFNNRTGIDLPGEREGFLPDEDWKRLVKDESWYIGDTYHMAIGQGDVLVTPLQILNFTSAIANGGTLYRPRMVHAMVNAETGEQIEVVPEIIRTNFIDQKNIEIVRQGMRQSVTDGSSRSLSGLPVSAAAKTGTAQWGGEDDIPHAWFTSFAPYENPELVITILIEEGEEGSTVAAPIARDFYRWYYSEYKK
ncbi:penicillin-binding protein 2 [Candidatus Falkowbacteria bacterium CG10_big_fil_rev_8_21_14_0_10_39_11]|uniref:Penicillin-binding protein 2 n=1 Tax=Candidatus Falkowbacteria bacterium CG10_big_fil_rev_8_21_14_0_10_39_11 TaxID=1974565 RepID=A0A2H0V4N4_9BACT|nr:MAG: penicillin-binding protein 2 [Candidatus Falkowbacteria bacterium CG10_big_fil_rev_8_21_14_0_10_39_11]